MVARACLNPGCDNVFDTKRKDARFCSDRCRRAYQRAQQSDDAVDLLTTLRGQANFPPPSPLGKPRWVRQDEVTFALYDGDRVVAHATDHGHATGESSWHASCRSVFVSPAMMGACGIPASLAAAKLVAEVMATGDVVRLLRRVLEGDETTEDTRQALKRMITLVEKAYLS